MAASNACIGIDLGTTYSCVGVWDALNDRVEIIANDSGERTTPSVVAWTKNERLVGRAAENQSARNPKNTVFGAKRLIGRRFSDETVQSDRALWPFEVTRGDDDKPMINVDFKGERIAVTAEEVSAAVLQKMKQTAEDYLGHEVNDAVVTVPAYFNDSQRLATKDAGRIAGLNVLRIINEPTAAAMAYGLHLAKGKESTILVYDLGGGTLDVSVVSIDDGVFEVKATSGDTHLGGEDIDNVMVDHFAREFQRATKLDMRKSERALRRLRTSCEKAKRVLSSAVVASVEIDSLFEGEDFNGKITRARFNELCSDIFLRAMAPINVALEQANLSVTDIDEVVLVGGSTKIVQLRELLSAKFKGKKLNASVNADEAVAMGAAIQASILAGTATGAAKEALLMDVTPLSLGVQTAGGKMAVVVPRGSTIPISSAKEFSTNRDGQTQVSVNIYEGERPMVQQNNLIGNFTVQGWAPMPRGKPRVEVRFDIDADGLLKVSATEKESNVTGEVTISNDAGRLSEEQVEAMLADAEKYREADEQQKQVDKWRNTIESYAFAMKAKVQDRSEMPHYEGFPIADQLADDERKRLVENADKALCWLDEGDDSHKLDVLQARQQELEAIMMPISSAVFERIKQKHAEANPPQEGAAQPSDATDDNAADSNDNNNAMNDDDAAEMD